MEKRYKQRNFIFLQIIIGIAFLLLSISVAYYLVIFVPNRENAKQEISKRELEMKENELRAKDEEKKIFKDCNTEASDKAEKLLKQKIDIATKSGTFIPSTWKEAANQGLHLKEDYQTYYDNCLQTNGLKK